MTQINSNRIKWVDMAKGIAMLMVIVGHTTKVSKPPLAILTITAILYSFHIPVFIILSGYTSKCVDSKEKLVSDFKKSLKKLFIPAYIWRLVIMLLPVGGKFHHTALQLTLCALFANAVPYELNDISIPGFGAIWFLVMLFVLKNMYNLINYISKGKFMTWISIGVTAVGVLVGQKICLPFSIDVAMAAMIFYHIGQKLKERKLTFSAKKLCISLLIWLGTFSVEFFVFNSYFDLGGRLQPLFPLPYITAAAGSLTCMYVCMYLCEHGRSILRFFTDQISFIGCNSMTLYIIHHLDQLWYISNPNMLIRLLIRFAQNLGLFYAFIFLRDKFRERKKEPGSKNAQ